MDISKGSSRICAFRHSRSLLVALALCGIAVPAAKAAPVTYTDRPTWLIAIGMPPTGGENFDTFTTSDTSFDGTSISIGLGTMTIGTQVAANNFRNVIDVPPDILGGIFSIDGTPYANIFNGNSGAETIPFIRFITPVSAFFADFIHLNDNSIRTNFQLFADGGSPFAAVTPPISTSPFASSFGFVTAGECVTELRMQRVNNDVFGMDNIQIKACLTVPEPASLSLFVLGLIGLVASSRWRSWAR